MVALKGQAQQHTADMRESASAASSAALRPPVQSPFVGATAREVKPEVSFSAFPTRCGGMVHRANIALSS